MCKRNDCETCVLRKDFSRPGLARVCKHCGCGVTAAVRVRSSCLEHTAHAVTQALEPALQTITNSSKASIRTHHVPSLDPTRHEESGRAYASFGVRLDLQSQAQGKPRLAPSKLLLEQYSQASYFWSIVRSVLPLSLHASLSESLLRANDLQSLC